MLKKQIKLLLSACSLLLILNVFVVPAFATNNHIAVYLDGTQLTFDVSPTMVQGRTIVPMRKIFEAMGANVVWNNDNQSITATKGATSIWMQVNNTTMYKNEKEIHLDVPPTVVDGRTLVPVRAVSEALNASVNWSQKHNTVSIGSNGLAFYKDYPNVVDYGAFMSEKFDGENMLADTHILQYAGIGPRDIRDYYTALEATGYKLIDSRSMPNSLSLVFGNSAPPIAQVTVIINKDLIGTRIEISTSGDYNIGYSSTKTPSITNTFLKTYDGKNIYKSIEGVNYVRIADFGLAGSGFTLYNIEVVDQTTWKLKKYDAMKDVESYVSSGTYVKFEDYAYIELTQYLEKIASRVT